MSILKVARLGHPVLRARARSIEAAAINSSQFEKLIDDMIETMHEYKGIGLAAPQVHESVRLFVAGIGEREEDDIVLINPEIDVVGAAVEEDWEGCLSIPDVRGRVRRAHQIVVRALDRRARRLEMDVRGFAARVVQHETDHLDGVLFLDRMKSLETLTFLEEFGRFWSREEVVPE